MRIQVKKKRIKARCHTSDEEPEENNTTEVQGEFEHICTTSTGRALVALKLQMNVLLKTGGLALRTNVHSISQGFFLSGLHTTFVLLIIVLCTVVFRPTEWL